MWLRQKIEAMDLSKVLLKLARINHKHNCLYLLLCALQLLHLENFILPLHGPSSATSRVPATPEHLPVFGPLFDIFQSVTHVNGLAVLAMARFARQ